MTQDHPSKLSFSIEESVWLNKGQEVEEIIGMSLEPEIVIEERDQHVYIKGGLQLIGEYKPVYKDDVINLASKPLADQLSFRSPNEVDDTESGKIKHFFPIDVTIPTSRIQNLDEVYVQVESFDYDLPEKSCIQLTADISISGMTTQESLKERQDSHEKKQEAEPFPTVSPAPTAFAFEAKKQAQQKIDDVPVSKEVNEQGEEEPAQYWDTASVHEEVEIQSIDNTPPSSTVTTSEQKREDHKAMQQERKQEVRSEVDTSSKPIEKEVATTRFEEPEKHEVREMKEETEEEQFVDEQVEEPSLSEQEDETKVTISPLKSLVTPRYEDHVSDEPVEEKEAEPPREENTLYLTKMLSKGEERFAKWKMCIIQENESLETIATRYDISTSQIIRVNRLQGEQVEEGQILYIPVTSES